MYKIALVDDEFESAELLSHHIEKYANDCGILFNISRFKNGLNFIEDYTPEYDIVFMDIDMPQMNGLEAVEKLREIDSAVLVVFVTYLSKYATHGYKYDALDYMVKPISYSAFRITMDRAIQREDGSIYPLIGCPAVYEPGVASYTVLAGAARAETCVFSLEDRAMGARCVALRSEERRAVRITWLIRFALGEREEFTRCRAEDPFVFARSGDFPGVAWAAMEAGRCRAVSPAVCFGLAGEEAPPALTGPVRGVGSVGFLTRDVVIQPREG